MNQRYEGYEDEWVRCDYAEHRSALRALGVEILWAPRTHLDICRRGDLRAANVLVSILHGVTYSLDVDALAGIAW